MKAHDQQSIIAECEQYLLQEKNLLASQLRQAQAVRAAVIDRNLDALDAALQITSPADASTSRQRIRERIAVLTGQPANQVTLSSLGGVVSLRSNSKIGNLRADVLRLAESVNRTNRANAILAFQLSNLLGQAIDAMTGNKASSTYCKSGRTKQNGDGAFLLQQDC